MGMEIIRINQKILISHSGALIPALLLKRWEEFEKIKKKYSLLAWLSPGKLTVVFSGDAKNIPKVIEDYTQTIGITLPNRAKIN